MVFYYYFLNSIGNVLKRYRLQVGKLRTMKICPEKAMTRTILQSKVLHFFCQQRLEYGPKLSN